MARKYREVTYCRDEPDHTPNRLSFQANSRAKARTTPAGGWATSKFPMAEPANASSL
jgi:hypothetical protein